MDLVVNLSRFYVCDVDALDNNEIRQITPPGQGPVAVYRIADAFYATDDVCSHGQALLSEGEVDEDYVVECPWHGGTFDVRTGEALSFPCVLPIKVYPVTVEGGKLYLDLAAGDRKPQ
ncbi:non-heme iron oxygenase ferredoxin subunit [Pseudomonas stutzeri]|jgi:nitrite reductase/ring-hydroxylating ferredoxin subunit|uniref:non-heme iron oxygenase ferredoxin subunit n=1 Tax=Stutzerimonas balearica TaxID=74829 RepID=UPI001375FBBD|nr:non-heme iron oxygenase ferredoxin subunit [Stutzerimonas balearica]MCF6755790.1 non-heme iron oxygenase ferredoxin subunit [Stutzerimonas balearica]NCT78855.1 non-heme iron oxygenase ferredoxin subunit [Stutzerimonas stutzeri]